MEIFSSVLEPLDEPTLLDDASGNFAGLAQCDPEEKLKLASRPHTMNPAIEYHNHLTRRRFFEGAGLKVGGLALSALMGRSALGMTTTGSQIQKPLPGFPNFAPKVTPRPQATAARPSGIKFPISKSSAACGGS